MMQPMISAPPPSNRMDSSESLFTEALTNQGQSLAELSQDQAILAVFLRHSGCTFCREALADIAKRRAAIEAQGVKIALIHMSTPEAFAAFTLHYGLNDLPAVSDPDRRLYRSLGLRRGNLAELCGWNVWLRGAQSFFTGNGAGRIQGDIKQMPGLFLIHHGRIIKRYFHTTAADRPDYLEICQIPA